MMADSCCPEEPQISWFLTAVMGVPYRWGWAGTFRWPAREEPQELSAWCTLSQTQHSCWRTPPLPMVVVVIMGKNPPPALTHFTGCDEGLEAEGLLAWKRVRPHQWKSTSVVTVLTQLTSPLTWLTTCGHTQGRSPSSALIVLIVLTRELTSPCTCALILARSPTPVPSVLTAPPGRML